MDTLPPSSVDTRGGISWEPSQLQPQASRFWAVHQGCSRAGPSPGLKL